MSDLIGVDAGGTKTVAAIQREGTEVARATGRGAAVQPGRAMSAAGAIAAAVREALGQAGLLRGDLLVVGAAGAGREEEQAALRDALRIEGLADRLKVTTDLEIALRAALGQEAGIVLLAGTGSVAVARLPDGALDRQGGYGWQMGDEGAGYALGREALRAAGRARDGRGPETGLLDAVLALTRSREFDDLVRWSVLAGPTEVASLAPAVLEQAAAGDRVAQDILERAARDLAAHVEALIPRFPKRGRVPVALGGGILEQTGLRALVVEALARLPRLVLREEPLDAVEGALALARDLAGEDQ
jgi:N-acetylglucosamine kinase-like BadF-type ATPase